MPPRTVPPHAEEAARGDDEKEAALEEVSLAGLEARLSQLGEVPRFAVPDDEPGRLRHVCRTMDAVVTFWPGTLQWCTSGRQALMAEEAICSASGVLLQSQAASGADEAALMPSCDASLACCVPPSGCRSLPAPKRRRVRGKQSCHGSALLVGSASGPGEVREAGFRLRTDPSASATSPGQQAGLEVEPSQV